jgi:hypothetical protein
MYKMLTGWHVTIKPAANERCIIQKTILGIFIGCMMYAQVHSARTVMEVIKVKFFMTDERCTRQNKHWYQSLLCDVVGVINVIRCNSELCVMCDKLRLTLTFTIIKLNRMSQGTSLSCASTSSVNLFCTSLSMTTIIKSIIRSKWTFSRSRQTDRFACKNSLNDDNWSRMLRPKSRISS